MSLTQDSKPADTKPNTGKGKGKKVRIPPVGVGFVDVIPPRTKHAFWSGELAELRDNAGKSKQYEAQSATTASYVKGKYGLETATRSRPDGKVDMYVMYPAKEVDGELVPDDAKVARIKEEYGRKEDKEQ